VTDLSKRNIALIRLPQPASSDEYEHASGEIEQLLGELPGIVAVYRTGGVSVPGISDIDRVAVVEKRTAVPSIWEKLPERTRYLAMHAPLLADRDTFRRHRWFAHLEPLELASGTAVELEDPPPAARAERLIAAESIVTALLSAVKQVSTGVFKVRPSLCQFNNLRHALPLAGLDPAAVPDAWHLSSELTDLRRSWFATPARDRRERTMNLAARIAPALLEALRAMPESGAMNELRPMKLGAPWSNVTLVAAESGHEVVTGAPWIGMAPTRSARAAELVWRVARPKIALDPAVLALLSGAADPEHEQFRRERDALVRAYLAFLADGGQGYSPIGYAGPFPGATA
jgi:hypothetical protein